MDEERKTIISNALDRYKQTVLERNLKILRFLVEAMEAQPDPPKWPQDLAQQQRLDAFRKFYLMGSLPEPATTAHDLLSEHVRENLVSMCELDGVNHSPSNFQQRTEWFNKLQEIIAEKNLEAEEFPPAELKYLCTLVDTIHGPGLPYHRERQQFDFVSSLDQEVPETTASRVVVPIREGEEEEFSALMGIWEDWQIAVGVRIGDGPREWGGSYALYCRNDSNDQWQWRYGVHDEDWRSDLYDSVESFLDYYAHHNEQTEENTRQDVKSLQGMI
jgi:hypothetical protein